MSGAKAWALIEEADALREQGDRGEKSWSELQVPIRRRVEKAVQLAPKESTILFMGTWLLLPYAKAGDSEAKKIAADCQQRLDQLGEPSKDVLDLVGGKAAYEKHRSTVQGVVGSSGCAVAMASAMAIFASVSLLAFRIR